MSVPGVHSGPETQARSDAPARELSLADTMGFEPEEFRVVDDGLTVFFGPKQPR